MMYFYGILNTNSRPLKFDLVSFTKTSANTKLRRLVWRSESIAGAKGSFFKFAYLQGTHAK